MSEQKIKQRFNKLIEALKLEKSEEIQQYDFKAKELSIQEKIINGICIFPVMYKATGYTDSGRCILSFEAGTTPGRQFKTGQPVKLFNSEEDQAKGIIRHVKSMHIEIITDDETIQDWITKGKIGIQIQADTKTLDYLIQQMEVFTLETNPLMELFYNFDKESLVDLSDRQFTSSDLNESQIMAVQHILGQDPISIVHGPPGTGKTTCLISAIKELNKQSKKILVTAPTHAAVDHICRQLIDSEINFLRIGNDLKVDQKVEPYLLESKIKNDSSYQLIKTLRQQEETLKKKAFQFKRNFGKEEYQDRKKYRQELKSLRKDIRKINNDIGRYHLDNSNIILGTFIGLKQIENDINLCDFLIIDEAGQAIEPAIWLLSPLSKKIVMAGDHCQLPPTILSKQAEEMGLAISALEMTEKLQFPTSFLNTQYRMHDKIMQFSNHFFYQNKLKTGIGLKNETNHFFDFIDTSGCGFEESKDEYTGSISNPHEIDIISKIIASEQVTTDDIAIISPYRSQIELLKVELPELTDSINTIDAFQGQERQLIIISLVRSNPNSEIGFLNDYRRMNVALTRAKNQLIIIGDSSTFGHDQFYNALLDYVESNGNYRTAWEFM